MRPIARGLILVAALSSGACVIYTNPPPARRPPPPAPAPAQPTPTAAQPAPAATTATRAPTTVLRPIATQPAKTGPQMITVNGKPVPTITQPTAFGSGTQTAGSLQGLVYFIPETSAKFPDVSAMVPTAALFTNELNIAPRDFKEGFPGVDNRFEWFAIKYTGSFVAPKAGAYGFRVLSDDGAIVRVDGTLVVDNDGVHPPQEKRGTINLTSGKHTLEVDYWQGPRYQIALQLWVTPPGAAEKLWNATP